MARQPRPVSQLVHDLRTHFGEHGIAQEDAAKGSKMSQTTVSRILKGELRTHTRALIRLCKYAKIPAYQEIETDPAKSQLLMQALRDTWDGSADHAKALARVIKSLRGLEAIGRKTHD
jgi:transcriptional regulator with XRE-family HTH domain